MSSALEIAKSELNNRLFKIKKVKPKWDQPKYNSKRKARKAHFMRPAHLRRIFMTCKLTHELKNKYGVSKLPIRREDEVHILRGNHKGREGKVVKIRRKKKYQVSIEKIVAEKANGQTYYIPFRHNNLRIIKLKLDKDRKTLLEAKAKRPDKQAQGKFTEKDVQNLQDVD